METKVCSVCFAEKSIDLFGRTFSRNKTYIRNNCKSCYNNAVRDSQSIRRRANAEQNKLYFRAYRKDNKEKFIQYRATAKQRNPSRKAEHQRKRQALLSGNTHTPYTDAEVVAYYGIDCHLCNLPIDLDAPRKAGDGEWQLGLHIDHLIPVSKGGADSLENVRPSHAFCNLSKKDKII